MHSRQAGPPFGWHLKLLEPPPSFPSSCPVLNYVGSQKPLLSTQPSDTELLNTGHPGVGYLTRESRTKKRGKGYH